MSNPKAQAIGYNLCLGLFIFLFLFLFLLLQTFNPSPSSSTTGATASLFNDWKQLLGTKTLIVGDGGGGGGGGRGSAKPDINRTNNYFNGENPNLNRRPGPARGNCDRDHESETIAKEDSTDTAENIPGRFHAVGVGAYLFIHMSTYRGGPDRFFINGLGSKPNHVFLNAGFRCKWIPRAESGARPDDLQSISGLGKSTSPNSTHDSGNADGISKVIDVIEGNATKMLPDWGYGRVYTTLVIMCQFDRGVGITGEGGELVLYASPTDSFDDNNTVNPASSASASASAMAGPSVQRIVALTEHEGEYDASRFEPPYRYEYMYCGSPLYGDLNPQRLREWLSYHASLLGPRAHFVLYDAGGVHERVRKVLEPWVRSGIVTLEDVRAQEQFDGYYHNQFLIVNDCLHRSRFLANWTFFFDIDEFLFTPRPPLIPGTNGSEHNTDSPLGPLLARHSRFSQLFFEQAPMSAQLCLASAPIGTADSATGYNISRMWGFEKLVWRSVKKGVRRDRKYAVQPRNVLATGVHLSQNLVGKSLQLRWDELRYYHYHGTTSFNAELCRHLINISNNTSTDHQQPTTWFEDEPFVLDLSMQELTPSIKSFESEHIGNGGE